MNISDCREIHKEGFANTQFEQRKFDAIGRLLLEVDRLTIKDAEFRALLDWRMCSDPFPCNGIECIDRFINGVSETFGFKDWIDAYHGFSVPNAKNQGLPKAVPLD